MQARNKKNKQLYEVLFSATDATNSREGEKVIVYRNDKGKLFVRELKEFYEKFEKCD